MQTDRVGAVHGGLALGKGDEAASDTGRVGGRVFQIPAVSRV